MTDRECALRFLAFVMTPYDQYKSQDLDGFLHRQMQTLNRMSDAERAALGRRFIRAMQIAYLLFGRDAFRKRYRATDPRKPINKALFEAWSVNLDAQSKEKIEVLLEREEALKNAFMRLMNDRAFDAAVTQGTGDVGKVRLRFEAIKKLIDEVLR
jgi:hypothetical protein